MAIRHIVTVTSAKRGLGASRSLHTLIKRCINQVLIYENIDFRCEVVVTLTDDRDIQGLNFEHRGKNMPTDVLSFPMLDWVDGSGPPPTVGDVDQETGAVPLGDVVISLERAQAQALEYSHSLDRECGFLTVHSVLHLLGYDHEAEEERRVRMRNREEAILDAAGLTRLPDANGSEQETQE